MSADVFFRFRPRTGHRLMPHAAAGYTTSAFRGSARPFANVAIGTDVNVGPKAIRIEIREHAGLSEEWANRHIFGVRFRVRLDSRLLSAAGGSTVTRELWDSPCQLGLLIAQVLTRDGAQPPKTVDARPQLTIRARGRLTRTERRP